MDQPVLVSLVLAFILGLLLLKHAFATRERPQLRSVAILVLGDVGRSPRMMYHAESFATNQFETYIIGNKGTTPIPSLLSLPRVRFLYLPDSPKPVPGMPFVLSAPRKIALQIFYILEALFMRVPQPPEFIIVQNPPSIPSLALVWLVGVVRGSKVIIDWHNLGYSILALKLGQNHIFVRIAEWFEGFFGRSAYAHLFVTRAMHDHLIEKWDLRGLKVVLHDRPPAHFHKASPAEMHELFVQLNAQLTDPALDSFLPKRSVPYSTPFTEILSGNGMPDLSGGDPPVPALRADRPALLVSSTSWTPDEDFGLLLDALTLYDQKARAKAKDGGHLPKVLMIVTGKGPDKDKYMKRVAELQGPTQQNGKTAWTYVRCISRWLDAADYPLLLGSADLGISLHSSSSALDLPMKVVDMFGCGLPVCALDFACLNELVRDGVNGLVFRDAEQLATQLESLLADFPASHALSALRSSLIKHTPVDPGRTAAGTRDLRSPDSPSARAESPSWPGRSNDDEWEWSTWTQNWDRVMKPLLLSDLSAER